MLKVVAESVGGGRKLGRTIGAVALAVAAAAALWYSLSGSQSRAPTAKSRTAFDFIVTWRCLACGATHDGPGGVGPVRCEKCGKDESYASIRYACPTHGAVPVAFQYNEKGKAAQIRVGDGAWTAFFDADGNLNTRCPKCQAMMSPAEPPRPRPRG